MLRWSGSTTRRYPCEPLSLDGTRGGRPFTGITPIRSARRPSGFTVLESAGAIAFAVLMGAVGWAATVALLSLPMGR